MSAGDGRGAWTGRGKASDSPYYCLLPTQKHRDGEVLPGTWTVVELEWFHCVSFGVTAIQSQLILRGFLQPDQATGYYGKRTRDAVKKYQEAHGIDITGKVGSLTFGDMVRPQMDDAGEAHTIDPKWIYGVCRKESNLDPGAQGWDTPDDRGLWQFNTTIGVSVPDAFDVAYALERFCNRWNAGWKKYKGKGPDLRLDCTILQHRSPLAADFLFTTETSFGPESDYYIQKTKELAESW